MEENLTQNKRISHAFKLYNDGADLIDVGGESTRPGSKTVNKEDDEKELMKS